MNVKETLTEVKNTLPDMEWITSPVHVKRLSKDFYWFSPLLVEQLADKKADMKNKGIKPFLFDYFQVNSKANHIN